MPKKNIAELQPGDIIYKVLDGDGYYVPKIIECKVNKVTDNYGLSFPEHCRVYYIDPREPDKETFSSLGGNSTCSYNGALYYSDKEEAYTRWVESAKKAKDMLTRERERYSKFIEQLDNDWNSLVR